MRLVLEAGPGEVAAAAIDDDGRVAARAETPVSRDPAPHAAPDPAPGTVPGDPAGPRHEEVWRATLASVHAVADDVGSDLHALAVRASDTSVAIWDRETLSSPRPVLLADDRSAAARLAWLAHAEPHTWALVLDGRYAVGTLESYLVARTTRGLWHLTDRAHAARTTLLAPGDRTWSPALCDAAGIPVGALPEVVDTWERTAVSDPRVFAGLELPLTDAPDPGA